MVSTACLDSGEAAAHTCRTPFHGSWPSASSSRNTHRLPASRAASRAARPTAMWSAWLGNVPPYVSRKLLVITTSGRCRRTARAMSRRSGSPYSTTPSGCPRNSTVSTPTTRAEAICSASRSGPHSSGLIASIPASPLVTIT